MDKSCFFPRSGETVCSLSLSLSLSVSSSHSNLRLLSSYLHLVKAPNAIKRYKTLLLKRNKSTTWEDFYQSALSGMRNPHWYPQTDFCGLRKYWPHFNFVGNFELIQQHGPELATRLDLSQYSKTLFSLSLPFPHLGHPFLSVSSAPATNGWARTTVLKGPLGEKSRSRIQDILSRPLPVGYNQGDCMWCKNRAQHQVTHPLSD
jgi:hypothetical protein